MASAEHSSWQGRKSGTPEATGQSPPTRFLNFGNSHTDRLPSRLLRRQRIAIEAYQNASSRAGTCAFLLLYSLKLMDRFKVYVENRL